MFRENEQHLQFGMFDTFQQLPEKVRQRLEESWAGTFYREVFCRIDESLFAILYSDQPSRPNVPINILVGAEILKSGFGWSDEELHDEMLFNLQVRYALGLRDMSTVPFELRTLYYFRQRLSRHMQERGENLLDQVFVQVTDEQLDSLKVKTGHQRMDSVLISSNIRQFSRLQLFVEVVQRVWRMLTARDQAHYAEVFEPYRQGTSGQYCYRLKAEEVAEHLTLVGQVMAYLLRELEARYADQPTYQMLRRVFDEHYVLVAGKAKGSDGTQVRVKEGDELSGNSLQSPDDWEATFRNKKGQGYRGYVANLTETCDPENKVQLLTKVQVDSNFTDDEDLVVEAVPELKARTDLAVLWTDGGYNGPAAAATMRKNEILHIPTNVRGCHPSPDRLGRDSFSWEVNEEGEPVTVGCPGGQLVEVRAGRTAGNHLADFDATLCQACPLAEKCPTDPKKLRPARVLYVKTSQVRVARMRQRAAWARKPGNNRRAAIESTVRSVTHPFGGQAGKLPVRGKCRVSQIVLCSALMVNLRRIWRYERKLAEKKAQDLLSLLSRCWLRQRPWFRVRSAPNAQHLGLSCAKA
jgi:hypothetical protein